MSSSFYTNARCFRVYLLYNILIILLHNIYISITCSLKQFLPRCIFSRRPDRRSIVGGKMQISPNLYHYCANEVDICNQRPRLRRNTLKMLVWYYVWYYVLYLHLRGRGYSTYLSFHSQSFSYIFSFLCEHLLCDSL